MDYGNLLTKAWKTVWNNKFLIGLGLLVALGSGGGGGGGGGGGRGGSNLPSGGPTPTPGGGNAPFDPEQFAEAFRQVQPFLLGLGGLIFVLIIIVLVIAVTLAIVGRIAQGGLIAGVNDIDGGRPSGFVLAWTAGWNKGWQLIVISLIAAVPNLILLLALGGMIFSYFTSPVGQSILSAWRAGQSPLFAQIWNQSSGFLAAALAAACLFTLVGWVMQAIKAFADRACMTEDKGVLESYERGFEVLRERIGPALILFLIQITLWIGLAILLILPTFIAALCCLLWPLILIISGTIQAYFSTLWTLAWCEWTGADKLPGEPVLPVPAPAG